MVPEYVSPTLCLKSSNKLPDFKAKISRATKNSRKRKVKEDSPCTTVRRDTETKKPVPDLVISSNECDIEQNKLALAGAALKHEQ